MKQGVCEPGSDTQGKGREKGTVKDPEGKAGKGRTESNHCQGANYGKEGDDGPIKRECEEQNKDISLTLLYVNAQSVVMKMSTLQAIIEAYKPDIIGVSESWSREDIGDVELNISCYNIFRKNRSIKLREGESYSMSEIIFKL